MKTLSQPLVVSILARPEERALRQHVFLKYFPDLFQSSPAPKSGRYEAARRLFPQMWFNVSILARPEERALHAALKRATAVVKFQSSPAPKSGRYTGR